MPTADNFISHALVTQLGVVVVHPFNTHLADYTLNVPQVSEFGVGTYYEGPGSDQVDQ
jgi:hypothetical protein